MMRKTILLTLMFAGCTPTEEGINRVIISGSVVIPPETVQEGDDSGDAANDEWAGAEELPEILPRYQLVEATTSEFSTVTTTGDVDNFVMELSEAGELTLSLTFETTSSSGQDLTTMTLALYDFAEVDVEGNPTLLGEVDSNGTVGDLSTSAELEAGTYGIQIVPGSSSEYDTMTYTLGISGYDPNDEDFLVGAYLTDDVFAHGNPVGGASVASFELDEETYTWSGSYEVLYLRAVGTCEEGDTACEEEIMSSTSAESSGESKYRSESPPGPDDDAKPFPSDTGMEDTGFPGDTGTEDTGTEDTGTEDTGTEDTGTEDTGTEDTGTEDTGTEGEDTGTEDTGTADTGEEPSTNTVVNEDIDSVYLIAGLMTNLNASMASGTFYSSEPVFVDTSANEAVEDVDVTVDDVIPKFIGWEYAEEEPNDVYVDASNYGQLDPADLAESNELPAASGPYEGALSYTDVITGSLDFESDISGWTSEETDFFALTTDETYDATITLSWNDATASDVDLHMYDSSGVLVGAGWALANTNPESFSTSDFGFYLEPDEVYYLGVIGYIASAGENEWDIEIEYATP